MLSGNISLTSEYSKLVPSTPHLWSEIILHALRLTQCLLCISCSVCVLFLFLIIYFNWRLITLQYCGSIHWHESAKDVHVSPFPKPLPLPSPSHPSGLSQCTGFECPASSLNLDWSSISHTVIYMFQCYFLKSSHPRFLPQSPKSVLYICVSIAVSCIGLSLPSF